MNKERRAYVCDHPDHLKNNMAWRQFLAPGDPVPRCPDHERLLTLQTNRPYNGRSTVVAPPVTSIRKGGRR